MAKGERWLTFCENVIKLIVRHRKVSLSHAGEGDPIMKKISLAAPAVRFGCVLGDVLIAGSAMFWLTLAFSWWALLVVALAGLLIGFYNVQVFRSVVFVDPGAKTVTLRGIQARTDQVAGASKVYTREVLVNGQTTRVIVIEGEDHSQLSIISTLNTINHGYASEIAAREVAGALGVQFCPSISPHLYDRKARRQYRQENNHREMHERTDQNPVTPGVRVNYDEEDDDPNQ